MTRSMKAATAQCNVTLLLYNTLISLCPF